MRIELTMVTVIVVGNGMDEIVRISLRTNAPKKGMNPSVPPP